MKKSAKRQYSKNIYALIINWWNDWASTAYATILEIEKIAKKNVYIKKTFNPFVVNFLRNKIQKRKGNVSEKKVRYDINSWISRQFVQK